jgi:hypothetical protein
MDQVIPFAGRRRRSRSEALRLAFEYEQSGLTRQAFCQQRGLSRASLDNYRKLRSKHSDARQSSITDLDLVPVELIDCVSAVQPQGQDSGIYVVLSKGRRLSIATGFDGATLVRLLAVLDEA